MTLGGFNLGKAGGQMLFASTPTRLLPALLREGFNPNLMTSLAGKVSLQDVRSGKANRFQEFPESSPSESLDFDGDDSGKS